MVLSEKWHFTESVPLLPVSGGASERLCLYSCFRWHLRASVPLLPVSGGDSGRLCLYFLFQVDFHCACASTSCFRWCFRASVPLFPVSGGTSGHRCLFFLFQMVLQCLYFLFKVAFHGVCASTSCFRWRLRASVPLLPVSDGASRHLCFYFLFQQC